MIVNESSGECRIAILQDGHLDELYEERAATATSVGNIYKGRVTNVEPAIQAAFVDYGKGQSGFLHISDLHPRYFPRGGQAERVGRKTPRRERPLMQEALRRGDEILVQVLKEGIGTKGPTLTSYLSIPGRLIVCMPYLDRVGVTRKVEDEDIRREARKALDQLDLPEGFGFILRTAGIGRPKAELKRDVAYLMRLWKVMDHRIKHVGAPCELYRESDLLIRTVRDVLRPSISAIVVDSDSAHRRASEFLSVVAPRSSMKVIRYRGAAPIFHAFDIERQIELIHSRSVPLPSGGSLVIEQTEALVAIDVNSGRSRESRDSEANALQTNMEAVDEICRQLRLRDLGGLIINDLIDMRAHRNRRKIEERMRDNLKRDRAKTTALPISEFGLVEMTRQRMRPSLRKTHFISCPHCNGNGEIKSPGSVGGDAVRHIRFLLQYDRVRKVEVVISPRVASVLLSAMRQDLVGIEAETGKLLDVRVSDAVPDDRVDFYAYDDRGADVDVSQLPALKMPTIEELEDRERRYKARGEKEERKPLAAAAGEPEARHGRRRRRRKGGPADASAISLAVDFADVEDFEDESEETVVAAESATTAPMPAAPGATADGKRPGRRRGRRGGRGRRRDRIGAEPVAVSAPPIPPTPVPAAPEAPIALEEDEAQSQASVRIHTLAKELGVPSKEILQRISESDRMEAKSHMSSVSGEEARIIRDWFAPPPLASAPATSSQSRAASQSPEKPQAASGMAGAPSAPPKGRRRRRRRGGGGAIGGAPSGTPGTAPRPVENAAASSDGSVAVTPAQDRAPDDAHSPADQPRRKRRRSRRRRGGRGEEAGDLHVAASRPPRTSAPAPAGRPQPAPPQVKSTEGSPSAAPQPSAAKTALGADKQSQSAAAKKRRALYRSHSRVSSMTREQTDRELAET